MSQSKKKAQARVRCKRRIRAKISGNVERPRLSVFRSTKHIYAQVIDDVKGHTLVAATDVGLTTEEGKHLKKKELAFAVGKLLAQKCKEAGINQVIFDRNGFIYHGRIQALADGARDGGLEF